MTYILFDNEFWRAKLVIFFLAGSIVVSANSIDTSGESLTRYRQNSKNAIIDIVIRNGVLVLNSTKKNDGSQLRVEIRVDEPALQKLPPRLTSCGAYSMCVSNGNVNHTIIVTNPQQEYITIERNLPVAYSKGRLIDCISLREDTQWIGGPELRYQHWPIQNMYFDEEPYVPTHPVNMAIAERYWLTSRGSFIVGNPSTPLFLDQNNYKDKYLCLIAKKKTPYPTDGALTSVYHLGFSNNSRTAHEFVINNFIQTPTGHPDRRMVEHPIWSTWARYKANVSEKVVREFADEILRYNFNNSQLEIDDNWETCYGSAVFDTVKFTNITRLSQDLKKKGFRVTLWIHPFINEKCEPAYSTALKNNYFVKNDKGEVHTTWWQGVNGAGAIDFSNPKAVNWWVQRLKVLEKLGIDSFKFDAGEISWLPQRAVLNVSNYNQPGIFTKEYVKALATNFDDVIEVRVGWNSQNLPIFVRMIDKDTGYTWNNGLPTLITTLLQMNMAGYVFVLPDMIGGNGYLGGSLNATFLPDKDLFIRWLQANVFMPSLQYSFVPWDYDNETIAISRKFTNLHASITPLIMEGMNASVKTGAPLNPPIWWVDPSDQEAHKINDEFLLGEKILVAPVIEANAVVRDIYLPRGIWKDANTNRTITGPTWLRDYPAPLYLLPYFIKQ